MSLVNYSQFQRVQSRQQTWQIDQAFYNSILALRCKGFCLNIFGLIKLILLIVFTCWFYSFNPKDHYFGAFIAQIIVSAISTGTTLFFLSLLYNMKKIPPVAYHINRLVLFYQDVPTERRVLQDHVRPVYSFYIDQQDLPEYTKKQLEWTMQVQNQRFIYQMHKWVFVVGDVANFVRVALLALFLVFVCKDGQLQGSLKFVTILLIVTEFINLIKNVIITVAVILSPITLLFYCLYKMCGRTSPVQAGNIQINLDERAVEYSQTRAESVHECTICSQNFSQGDQIVALPCHANHVFHLLCIKNWFRTSKTCPVCRTIIN